MYMLQRKIREYVFSDVGHAVELLYLLERHQTRKGFYEGGRWRLRNKKWPFHALYTLF